MQYAVGVGCWRIRTRSGRAARRCRRAGGGRRAPAAAGCRRGGPRTAADRRPTALTSTAGTTSRRCATGSSPSRSSGMRRGGGREGGQDAADRHRLPGHQGGPRRTPEALLAGHETRGHPREEHREPREDERDHGLHGDRRATATAAADPRPNRRSAWVRRQRRRMVAPPGRRGGLLALGACLDLGERGLDVVQLVGRRTVEEVQQRRSPVGDLHVVEGAAHRLGRERLTGVGGEVAPGTAVALAGDEVLLREAVEHGHHGRVGDLALALEAERAPRAPWRRRTPGRRRTRPPRGAP